MHTIAYHPNGDYWQVGILVTNDRWFKPIFDKLALEDAIALVHFLNGGGSSYAFPIRNLKSHVMKG